MERVNSRVQLLWIGRAVVVAAVLAGVAVAIDRFAVPVDPPLIAAVVVVAAVLGTVHAVLRFRRWRFEIQDDALFLVRGVVTQVDTSVPYVRLQHTDTQRGPVERLVGLSSVVVYTAGTRGADIRIPGLRPERATELREQLRELAAESEATDAV
ncbi:PH domain-containing protein [Halomicrobium sp. IBSBa]|uniref:PH domain-containing protein n=1 Tax=Halomicrobium sp. IBSBa TaxID=2778916 RepID=UPI001ABF2709|nr:PH domain-containing protein [Halomicrobium sp. IBSBa]MBO4248120.1 PH domain-containing protein [Halomicrobium sp. IBSBa]